MEAPLVSVIVLSYNSVSTIGRALRSVLDQKCSFQFEIVVGDDASADNSREVVENLMKEHPDVIRLMPEAPNRGMVRNYFYCLAQCRGKYITDCSADDYWTSATRLQRQVAMIERDADCVAVSTDWTYFDTLTGERTIRNSLILPSVADVLSERGLNLNLSTFLYRADVVRLAMERRRDVVENPDFGCEDVPVMCALAAAGKVERLPHSTLDYVVAKGSVSHSSSLEKEFRFQERSVRCILALAEYYDADLRYVSGRMRDKLSHMTSIAFRAGSERMDAVCRELWKASRVRLTLKAGLLLTLMRNRSVSERCRKLLERVKPL